MTAYDLADLRKELCNNIRNSDVLSTTIRGVTTKVDTFTATDDQTAFQLTQLYPHNIRTVTVDAVSKYYIKDYTLNTSTGILTLLTGATTDDEVVITYDYKSTAGDKIYPDMPRYDLTLESYPRIGIEILSGTTIPLGLGGSTHISEITVTIKAWYPVNKVTTIAGGLGGTNDLSDAIQTIRQTIITNAKLFSSNIPFIHPTGLSPITSGINNKIIQQGCDFNIKFIIE